MENLINEVRKSPFIHLIIPLLLGIVYWEYFPLVISPLYIIPIYILLFVLLFNNNYSIRYLWGILLYVNLFFIGCFLISGQQKKTNIPTDSKYVFKLIAISTTIKDHRVECQIEAYYNNNIWSFCNEKAYIYFKDTSAIPNLGDVFLSEIQFTEINEPQNPYEFNYKQYMARKAYFVTSYLDTKIVYIENKIPFYLEYQSKIQEYTKSIFTKAGIKDKEFAIISALTIGDKSYIDADLNNTYSNTGIIHLLAISGLHVGIIYAILNFMFSFVGRVGWKRLLKALFIISVLWLYAGIAGFSPSVIRASFMFTIFVIGDVFALNRNTYNSMAFSAFVICVIKPYSLFDLGFLLSYLAVFGIVFFQKRIYKLWQPKNRLLNYTWMLSTISIAAQLTTYPIILLYFNKFPNYFLLSNLIIIPLITLVMYLAVLLLCFSFISSVISILGAIIQHLLMSINKIATTIENLPHSLTEGIYINTTQCLVLYVFLLVLGMFCISRKPRLLQIGIVCLIIFFSIRLFHEKEWSEQYEIGQYKIKGAKFYYYLNARKGYKTTSTDKDYSYNTKQHLIRHGFVNESALSNIKIEDLPNYYKGVICFNGKYIGIASKLKHQLKNDKFNLDYILVDIPVSESETIFRNYNPNKIIVDKSLSGYQATKWREKCNEKIVD